MLKMVDSTSERRAIVIHGRLEKQIGDINSTSTENFIQWHFDELKRMENILRSIGKYDGLKNTLLRRMALRFEI